MIANLMIRRAAAEDRAEYLRMRLALWPEADPGLIEFQMTEVLDGDPSSLVALVAERADGSLGGLLELRIGMVGAPGSATRAAFISAWYVDADLRRQGVGSALMRMGGEWARARGCTAMHSDAEDTNDVSFRAHLANGFRETHRQVFFTKQL